MRHATGKFRNFRYKYAILIVPIDDDLVSEFIHLRESAVFLIFSLSGISPIRGTAESRRAGMGNSPSSFLLVLFVSFCLILFSTEAPTNLVAATLR